MLPVAEAGSLPPFEPVYPLTAGLSPKILRRAVLQALDRLPELPEWQDASVMATQSFPPFRWAFMTLHNPVTPDEISPESAAWRRLAYDELMAGQLALALVRAKTRRLSGRPLTGDGRILAKIRSALPYALTQSQEQAVAQ